MSIKNLKYKPLLLTTTMRNPERLKDFLSILYHYNKEVLSNSTIEKIVKNILKKNLYRPNQASVAIRNKWKSGIDLDDMEIAELYNRNPQSHKESGFDKGWPSRFDTWYKIAKELGFVWYEQKQKIRFTNTGKMLLDYEKPENETIVFVNALSKYQRINPFRRVLNNNVPLLLLLETINLLNNDPESKTVGISRLEIPLLLCWKDNNAKGLYGEIMKVRRQFGFNPSNETILQICSRLLSETKR
jgi:hypothetical protein